MRGHRAALFEKHGGVYVGGQLGEVIERQRGVEWRFAAHRGHDRQNSGVPLARLSWLVTVLLFVVAAILLLLNDYVGYFGVFLAVAAAAAVNLR